MNHAEFLYAIAVDPENDFPRLVYADWLEEQGHPLGELIRLEYEISQLEKGHKDLVALHRQKNQLVNQHPSLPFPGAEHFAKNVNWQTHNGIPQGVTIDAPVNEGLLSIAGNLHIQGVVICEQEAILSPQAEEVFLTLPSLSWVSLTETPQSPNIVRLLSQHPNLHNFIHLELDIAAEVTTEELLPFGRLPNLQMLKLVPEGSVELEPIFDQWGELRMQRWRQLPLETQRREAEQYWDDIGYNTASINYSSKNEQKREAFASQCRVSDVDLEHLSVFPELERIDLHETRIRGHGFRHLARLPNLTEIMISKSDIETIEGLHGMTQLKSLTISSYGCLTDEQSTCLSSLTGLEELVLSDTKISDVSLRRIGMLRKLKRLGLRLTGGFTPEGLSSLSDLKNLRSLTIWHLDREGGVNDESVIALTSLTDLEQLCLNYASLSDAGLAQLSSLKKLLWLNLVCNRHNHVTQAGVFSLIEQVPNLVVLAPCQDHPGGGETVIRGMGHESDWQRIAIDQHVSWEMSPIWSKPFETIDHNQNHEWELKEHFSSPETIAWDGHKSTLSLTRLPVSQADQAEIEKEQNDTPQLVYQWTHDQWVYTLICEFPQDRLTYLEPIFDRMADSVESL